MYSTEHSFVIPTTANSVSFAISTTSAQSAAIVAAGSGRVGVPVVIQSTVDCFIRRGTGTFSAVSDGTDMAIPASTLFRTTLGPGECIAAITASGSGTFRITPAA